MSVDLRKTLTDTGYIAIGIGVMGVQQANVRRRELRDRLAGTGSYLERQAREARSRLDAGRGRIGTQAQDLGTELRHRVEPLVEQVQGQLHVLPEQVSRLPEQLARAVEPVRSRVRERSGAAV